MLPHPSHQCMTRPLTFLNHISSIVEYCAECVGLCRTISEDAALASIPKSIIYQGYHHLHLETKTVRVRLQKRPLSFWRQRAVDRNILAVM